jgi:hypothetical protein
MNTSVHARHEYIRFHFQYKRFWSKSRETGLSECGNPPREAPRPHSDNATYQDVGSSQSITLTQDGHFDLA